MCLTHPLAVMHDGGVVVSKVVVVDVRPRKPFKVTPPAGSKVRIVDGDKAIPIRALVLVDKPQGVTQFVQYDLFLKPKHSHFTKHTKDSN